MTTYEALVAMFTADLRHARRIARLHVLDDTGRCKTCQVKGVRPVGCTLGAAALAAIAASKRSGST